MKPFMSNECYHPHCMRTDCDKCIYYTPKFLGIKVPIWLTKIFYYIENKLTRR